MNVKVVKAEFTVVGGGNDISAAHSVVVEGKARVYYNTQRWSEAPEWLSRNRYYPTYFNSLTSALNCAGQFCWSGEVWQVKVRKVHTVLPEGLDTVIMAKGQIRFLRRNPFSWPQGTRMAERIILVKKLGTVYGSDYTPVNGGEQC